MKHVPQFIINRITTNAITIPADPYTSDVFDLLKTKIFKCKSADTYIVIDEHSKLAETLVEKSILATLARHHNAQIRSFDSIVMVNSKGNNITIDKKLISQFIYSPYIETYSESANVPFYPRLYQDSIGTPITINTWSDRSFKEDKTKLPLLKPLFDYTYYILCNGIETSDINNKTMQEYMDILNNKIENLTDNVDRQFWILHHFFALNFQYPSVPHPVALHLISSLQGAGKTTMFKIFGIVMDGQTERYTKEVKQSVFEDKNAWGDFKNHTGIVVINDISRNNPVELNSLIKAEVDSIGSEDLNIKGKSIKTSVVFRRTYGFTGNKLDYVNFEKGDRRNHAIEGASQALMTDKNKENFKDQLLKEMQNNFYSKSPLMINNDAFEGLAWLYGNMDNIESVKDARKCVTEVKEKMSNNQTLLDEFWEDVQPKLQISSDNYSKNYSGAALFELFTQFIKARSTNSKSNYTRKTFINWIKDDIDTGSDKFRYIEKKHEFKVKKEG